jgi:hypothetical protein
MAEVRGGAEGALTESPGQQPNSIHDIMNNRECCLVFWRINGAAIVERAGGVPPKAARRTS